MQISDAAPPAGEVAWGAAPLARRWTRQPQVVTDVLRGAEVHLDAAQVHQRARLA